MLGNRVRKQLSDHNWLDLMRQESNPTQTWKRTQIQVQKAIDDLVLLADSLPDDKQEQIFNYENINRLISSILRQPFWIDSDHDELDGRRIQLAALLVEVSLKMCIAQYKTIIEKDEILSAANISLLQNAINLSNHIALKLQLQERELKTKNENLIFLFNWNNILHSDNSSRLRQFLKRGFDLKEWIESAMIKKTEDDKTISFNAKEENNNLTSISIKLNDNKTGATLSIYDKYGNEQYNKKLIIKDENGNLNVYAKKTKTYKNKRKDRLNNYNTVPSF